MAVILPQLVQTEGLKLAFPRNDVSQLIPSSDAKATFLPFGESATAGGGIRMLDRYPLHFTCHRAQ
jgi:hypothetical protein